MSPTSSICARTSQLNSRVSSAVYDESHNRWEIQIEQSENATRVRAQFLIGAVGILSAQYTPPFEDIDSFSGDSFHTSRWPHEKVDFSGKRVGVIGTGATAVQLIPIVAKEAGHLTVFQRTPNYCAPLRNSEVTPETQSQWKADYPEMFKRCRETPAGFKYDFDPRSALEVSEEERLALYEELWALPGFKKWLGNFHDIMTNREANEDLCRVCPQQDPRAGQRSSRGGNADPQGSSVRFQAHSAGDRVLRSLQTGIM